MTEFEKLAELVSDPGSFGDTIKLRMMEGGGCVLEKMDGTGEIVLDPDQMKDMRALLVSNPEEMRQEIIDRMMEQGVPGQIVFVTIVVGAIGTLIGLVAGAFLF